MEQCGNPCSILFWLMPEKPGSKSWCHNSQVLPKKIVWKLRNPKCHWQKERGKTKAVHSNRPQKLLLVGRGQNPKDFAGHSKRFCSSTGQQDQRMAQVRVLCSRAHLPLQRCPCTPERKEKNNHKHNRAYNRWLHMNITKTTNEVWPSGRCPQPSHTVMWKLWGPRGP